eukprot:15567078-Heterocapsa_arctica.AAC.1
MESLTSFSAGDLSSLRCALSSLKMSCARSCTVRCVTARSSRMTLHAINGNLWTIRTGRTSSSLRPWRETFILDSQMKRNRANDAAAIRGGN